MLKGDFTQNMGRVFIIYIGGCLGFGALLGVLEAVGVSHKILGICFVVLTIGFYALMGLLSRSSGGPEYQDAGRHVPALYNGMATASDWMSAASFIGMAGAIYAAGYDGLAFVLGWTGGYILVAVLLAPYLRKFGQFTIADFLGARYGGNGARIMGIIVLVSASFAYVVGQIYGTGIIASRYLGIDFSVAVFVGLGGILLCSMLGGMRALIWTQVAQYVVVIGAYMLPVVILSTKATGVPLPQLMYGQALQRVAEIQHQLGVANDALAPSDPINFFGLILCLMLGTASLPHVLARYFTTPSVRDARISVAWSLLFIFLLYITAPAYAAFAKLEIYQHVLTHGLTEMPNWAVEWSRVGMMTISNGQLHIDPDAVVLATPEIAGLPFVVAGLVAAGALAAALSSADGLLLSIANALSHDVYFRMINPKANPKRRLLIARTVMIVAAIAAAWVASLRPAGILTIVGWAFSLAASGLFSALVLGIWWKRTTNRGAVCGMAAGWGLCLLYILATQLWGMPLWLGVRNIAAGVFGIPLAFIVTVAVSLVTPAPSQEMQDFIDSIRVPRGVVRLARAE
jgi:cation/acetate symporter